MTTPWHNSPILILDFETTGLSAEKDMPVELGAVRIEDGEQVAKWQTFIHPQKPIPSKLTAIHGISDAMVSDAPNVQDAFSAFRATMMHEGAYPCAYNAPFDKRFWFAHSPTSKAVKLLDPDYIWLDPLVMVRHFDRFVSGKGRHKLETTCKRWGIDVGQMHRAGDDCEATGKLLMAMRGKLPEWDMEEILIRQETRRREQDADRVSYRRKSA